MDRKNRFHYLFLIFFIATFMQLSWSLNGLAQENNETQQKDETTIVIEEEKEEFEDVVDELNVIQEEIFRSKARTMLLQEFLANTEVQIYFLNETHSSFRLKTALYLIDNAEVYKKEYTPENQPKEGREHLIFEGGMTPGRHEISVILTYEATRSAGYAEDDYEFQVTGDFSFIAVRGETTVVTLHARDFGKVTDDIDWYGSRYHVDVDLKVESKKLADRRRKLEKRRWGIMLEGGYWFENFQIVSNRLNIDQVSTEFLQYGGRAWWWFYRDFGVEGYYFQSSYDAPNGFGTNVDISQKWYGLDFMWRHKFTRSIFSPTFTLYAGYNFFSNDVSPLTTPVVRLSDDYQYINAGLKAQIPFHHLAGIKLKGGYFPFMDLSESPGFIQSGSNPNARGFEMGAGLYYNFWGDMSVELNYNLLFLDNIFTGTSTRVDQFNQIITNVQTRTIYQGFNLGLKYEF